MTPIPNLPAEERRILSVVVSLPNLKSFLAAIYDIPVVSFNSTLASVSVLSNLATLFAEPEFTWNVF